MRSASLMGSWVTVNPPHTTGCVLAVVLSMSFRVLSMGSGELDPSRFTWFDVFVPLGPSPDDKLAASSSLLPSSLAFRARRRNFSVVWRSCRPNSGIRSRAPVLTAKSCSCRNTLLISSLASLSSWTLFSRVWMAFSFRFRYARWARRICVRRR